MPDSSMIMGTNSLKAPGLIHLEPPVPVTFLESVGEGRFFLNNARCCGLDMYYPKTHPQHQAWSSWEAVETLRSGT